MLLMAARSPGPLVVLDLGGVEFIDSTALGTLLKGGQEVEESGKGHARGLRGRPGPAAAGADELTNRFQLCLDARREAHVTA